jgi:hypothetical protein
MKPETWNSKLPYMKDAYPRVQQYLLRLSSFVVKPCASRPLILPQVQAKTSRILVKVLAQAEQAAKAAQAAQLVQAAKAAQAAQAAQLAPAAKAAWPACQALPNSLRKPVRLLRC